MEKDTRRTARYDRSSKKVMLDIMFELPDQPAEAAICVKRGAVYGRQPASSASGPSRETKTA